MANKCIIVYGSSGQLGRAVVEFFQHKNWTIFACSTNKSYIDNFQSQKIQPFPDKKKELNDETIFTRRQTSASIHTNMGSVVPIYLDPKRIPLDGSPHTKVVQTVWPYLTQLRLMAAVCCSGGFSAVDPLDDDFIKSANSLIEKNVLPVLSCTHAALNLFKRQEEAEKDEQQHQHQQHPQTQTTHKHPQTTQKHPQTTQQQQVLPLLVFCGAAAVLNFHPTHNIIAYGAAKAYVHHLVLSLSQYQTQNPHNLRFRVCGLAPVMLDTATNRAMLLQQQQQQKEQQQQEEQLLHNQQQQEEQQQHNQQQQEEQQQHNQQQQEVQQQHNQQQQQHNQQQQQHNQQQQQHNQQQQQHKQQQEKLSNLQQPNLTPLSNVANWIYKVADGVQEIPNGLLHKI